MSGGGHSLVHDIHEQSLTRMGVAPCVCPHPWSGQISWREGLSEVGIDTEVGAGQAEREGRTILDYMSKGPEDMRENGVGNSV